jgi:hypothetical protein
LTSERHTWTWLPHGELRAVEARERQRRRSRRLLTREEVQLKDKQGQAADLGSLGQKKDAGEVPGEAEVRRCD